MTDTTYTQILNLFKEALESSQTNHSNLSEDVKELAKDGLIPVGISNRHIHLSRKDVDILFGEGYELTNIKNISQPGQYACKECLTICGPKGVIEKVRVLGPIRPETQVEILAGDNFKLGIHAPLRLSGDLKNSASLTLIGPKGSVIMKEGAIVASRHIHMSLEEAKAYGVTNGQIVSLYVDGERAGILNNVIIRADEKGSLECHIDTEEANAFFINSNTKLKLIK